MPIIRHLLHGTRTEIPGPRKLYDVGIRVIGKPPDPLHFNDLEFASEYVCMELARALRLPVASGVMAVDGKDDWYCSLNFNVAQPEKLPPKFGDGKVRRLNPVKAAKFVRRHYDIACGITAFDIWMCNPDRHDKNLSFNELTGQCFIFDHGMALLRTPDPRAWIESRRGTLSLENSCIRPVLTDLEPLVRWAVRIREIPEFFIREVLYDATELGLTPDVAMFCADFLLERRETLLDLINSNLAQFPKASVLLRLTWPPLSIHDEFCDGGGV